MEKTRDEIAQLCAREKANVIIYDTAGRLAIDERLMQELAAGASWPYVPLNRVPIPPIDNVHILHYNPARPEAPGTFTAHMYFIPEATFLAWDKEPPGL